MAYPEANPERMGSGSSKPRELNIYDEQDVDSAMLSAVAGIAPNPHLLAEFVGLDNERGDAEEVKMLAQRVVRLQVET